MPPDPSAFLPLSPDVLLILLAVDGRPRHGYAIIRDVDTRTHGQVRLQTGALYRALKRLLADGLVHECDPPRDESSGDARRRYYTTSRLGHAVIDCEVARMADLVRTAKAGRASRAARVPRRPRLA